MIKAIERWIGESSEEFKPMSVGGATAEYTRKATPIERVFAHSPFSTVTVMARIRGTVTEVMLREAVSKVQARHPHLRVRLERDTDHNLWLTSERVKDIEIEVIPRESDDHWVGVAQEACQRPFQFNLRPAIRFILVQSASVSELIILCHHILCDGMSLAYLVRDLMRHLGDPSREIERLPDPIPITRESIPDGITLSPVMRFLIGRINRTWAAQRVVFDQEDYQALSEAYWANYRHQLISIELSEPQTSALVDRCRREKVTVNSALCAAFAGAQATAPNGIPYHPSIGVGVSLRDHLQEPVGDVMGFYAGVARLTYRYRRRGGFWENARRFHAKVRPRYGEKKLFTDHLTWLHLDPTILEAIPYKKLGGLVPPEADRYQELSAFAARDDVVLSILQRERMKSLDRVSMGTAVTNLGKLDVTEAVGGLQLDRLIMKPGGAFPLANINLVLGAVTCAGKLGLIIEYAKEVVDTRTMEETKDRALEFLLGD